MTPEERAQQIIRDAGGSEDALVSLIASVIREARQAAFEEAAAIADENAASMALPQYHRHALLVSRQIANMIRSRSQPAAEG